MARVDQYAEWILANRDKKGTPDFETVAIAYKAYSAYSQDSLWPL